MPGKYMYLMAVYLSLPIHTSVHSGLRTTKKYWQLIDKWMTLTDEISGYLINCFIYF
jgi:hypothetical protein